jgi:NADPH:quinone reductase-like Zn-dependent oxidoreductase
MTFKILLATKNGENISTNLVKWEESDLMRGDVTVAVDYSTVNYKDALPRTSLRERFADVWLSMSICRPSCLD